MCNAAEDSLPRLACVQHGDYGKAVFAFRADGPETYGGQRDTVEAFAHFAAGSALLVISLDAPSGERCDGKARYVGLPRLPQINWLPARIDQYFLARRIIAKLEAYQPTHIVLRTADLIGCQILSWANRRKIPVAAILAMRFDPAIRTNRRFCALANSDNVEFVANHNRVATQSLVDCGLRAEKAIAWDYAQSVLPENYPAKTRSNHDEPTLLFAGAVSESKGTPELVDAAARIRRGGKRIRLLVLGDGPYRAEMMKHPGVAEKWLQAPGSVAHDQVVRQMRDATLVIVPTRPSFPEALPLVIQESLAVRTPVLMTRHPTFVRLFSDGQGVRFFEPENPDSLARTILEVLNDPDVYASLSNQTMQAWRSFQVEVRFEDLLDRMANHWGLPSASVPKS